MTQLPNGVQLQKSQKNEKSLGRSSYSFLRRLSRGAKSREENMTQLRISEQNISESNISEQQISEQRPRMDQRTLSNIRSSNQFSDAKVQADFQDLYKAIANHVRQYYSDEYCRQENLRTAIASISAGLPITVLDLNRLLRRGDTRLGILFLCISWTILNRCLLIRLGICNSPGSTFLPPEVVETFQNFNLGRVDTEAGIDEHNERDWALLVQWKQTSAALLHPAYVTNGFSHVDSRLCNIERALQDLDPLLRMYALPESTNRFTDLRDILRKGARFAFTLFAEPYIWKFEWDEDNSSMSEKSLGREYEITNTKPVKGKSMTRRESAMSSFSDPQSDVFSVVIWPALLRVIDRDGKVIEGAERQLTMKKLLRNYSSLQS